MAHPEVAGSGIRDRRTAAFALGAVLLSALALAVGFEAGLVASGTDAPAAETELVTRTLPARTLTYALTRVRHGTTETVGSTRVVSGRTEVVPTTTTLVRALTRTLGIPRTRIVTAVHRVPVTTVRTVTTPPATVVQTVTVTETLPVTITVTTDKGHGH